MTERFGNLGIVEEIRKVLVNYNKFLPELKDDQFVRYTE